MSIEWHHGEELSDFEDDVVRLRRKAMMLFDNPVFWADAVNGPLDIERIANEAADCTVVLACLNEAIGVDGEQRAITKSGNDVDRGVR